MTDSVEVEKFMGGLVARADDTADMEHRWWFDITDAGRLVFCAEVIEYDESKLPDSVSGRHYVPDSEMAVPEKVRTALEDNGFEPEIYNTDAEEI